MLEKQVKVAYLGIGSNLGNRYHNIIKAKSNLCTKNIKILKTSNYYESYSWPDPTKPKFLNIVVKIVTNNSVKNLLRICKDVEALLGRKKTFKNAPRTCDIDILDYNNEVSSKGVNLPHPRIHKRNFVLIPLFETNKHWKHPIFKKDIKSMIYSLSKKEITSIKLI